MWSICLHFVPRLTKGRVHTGRPRIATVIGHHDRASRVVFHFDSGEARRIVLRRLPRRFDNRLESHLTPAIQHHHHVSRRTVSNSNLPNTRYDHLTRREADGLRLMRSSAPRHRSTHPITHVDATALRASPLWTQWTAHHRAIT
jgi:hypothetical protein